jgi:hypothetical protein
MARKKLTHKEIDAIHELAVDVFESAYLGQYNRIGNAIERAAPSTLSRFEAAAIWADEPELVQQAVQKWYDDNYKEAGRDIFDTIDLDTEWADVNESLLEASAERAGWFSRAMTETSMGQTQDVIAEWLGAEDGTIGDLVKTMESVWTGPRPQTAALTETTDLVTQSAVTVGKAAGYWGYNVDTRNDNRVRPEHERIARDGPYPFSNTDNMPPLDYNCRCAITFVREEPA